MSSMLQAISLQTLLAVITDGGATQAAQMPRTCAGERHRDNVLQAIGASLEAWVSQVKREKAVYHVLNMCSVDVTRKVLVAEAWVPVSAKARVQEALREAAHTTSASVSAPLACTPVDPTCLCTCTLSVSACLQ